MLCDNCKKNEANFHKVTNVNGRITEYHLCEKCAKKNNIKFDDFGSLVSKFKENFFNDSFFDNDFLLDNKKEYIMKDNSEYVVDNNINVSKYLESKEEKSKKNLKKLEKDLKLAVKEERYEDASKIKKEIDRLKKESE